MYVFAYCLIPNYFHLLVYSKENIKSFAFSKDLQIMLRSYTRAINKQKNRTGSLFQQNTKIKKLIKDNLLQRNINDDNYPLTCFHSIHQNPLRAKVSEPLEDWEMSSFQETTELRENQFMKKKSYMSFPPQFLSNLNIGPKTP